MFIAISSNIVMLIGFVLGWIIVQLDSTSNTYVCLSLLAHSSSCRRIPRRPANHTRATEPSSLWWNNWHCVLREQEGERERQTEKQKSVCLCWPTFIHQQKGRVSSVSNLLCLVGRTTLRFTASHNEEASYFNFPSPVFWVFCLLFNLCC